MEIDLDPLQFEETYFFELVEIMMVNTGEGLKTNVEEVSMLDYTEKMKVVYPKDKEKLIDFLNMCNIKGSEVMLWPYWSAVFVKELVEDLKKSIPNN